MHKNLTIQLKAKCYMLYATFSTKRYSKEVKLSEKKEIGI